MASLDWPRVHGEPIGFAEYRQTAQAFKVSEELGFEPEGEGEHLWLFIEKTDLSTQEMARRLAHGAGIQPRDVGVSGQKDRTALTRQWFSLWLPGTDVPVAPCELVEQAGGQLVRQSRHPRKLKRGVHRANRFAIHLRGELDVAALETRGRQILTWGVPNYFGPQRFGHQWSNLIRARNLMARGWRKRDDRQGMLLSAARSFLFNEVLAERVRSGNWAQALEGDVLMLEGTQSQFACDTPDASVVERVKACDLHPTGPMPGKRPGESRGEALALETRVIDAFRDLADGIARAGAETRRRALRVMPDTLEFTSSSDGVWVSFALPSGAFATSVLRELIDHPSLIANYRPLSGEAL
ncbi:tRNA pseudouridine(13) synthase TruD [Larsenimonas suaedae]|uniref:tRNA pseudouridine synthase D n=1 Tax=Larsenimonas suaedae TaxID=1851019 RepID=A0ABU1GX80_9GAMM|nr:tRNA pseudouridine(13) synthase TruD [Larsenimonas suaedae]MCM2973003.1 tRNA pseudouridine(13) synthase TruD [Larsenimonas suaedae]MDR5896440.1 tRNA pseudouridine(13) synthase TruD [Larsenimonas suaedae]